MDLPTKGTAQQRVDDIHAFRRELARLASEQALQLTPAQQQQLAAHQQALLADYAARLDVDASGRAGQLSLGLRIASLLGALALAASVFFLFYQVWGHFPTTAQVGVLVLAPLLALAATLLIRDRDRSGYFTKLAAMVAFACFVLDLGMLGQIFNITPSDLVFIPWALFAFLLAYACGLRLLLATGLLCVIALVAARIGRWDDLYWLDTGMRPENILAAGLLVLAWPLLVSQRRHEGFAQVFRLVGLLAVFVPVFVLAWWGEGSYLPLHEDIVEGLYQLAGFSAAAAAIWVGAQRGWNDTLHTGMAFFIIFMLGKAFDWWWELLPRWLFFLVLGAIAVLLILALRRLRVTAQQSATGDTP